MQDAESVRLNRLGLELAQAGQEQEAEQLFGLLVETGMADFETLKSYAIQLASTGRCAKAEPWMRHAIALNGADPVSHNVLSFCLIELEKYEGAAEAARQAVLLAPHYPEAQSNLGLALNRLGRNIEALPASEAALRLQPDDPANLLNHGNVLRDLGRTDEALALAERACALAPKMVQAHYNLGNLLSDAGRHADAVAAFGRAVDLDANHSSAHWNRALCNLLLGDFQAGWPEYEWRWKDPVARPVVRHFDCPLWLGQTDIAGKSILIHCEQGLGDALQFIRYASVLVELGATVHVEAFAPLATLFAAIPGVAAVQPPGQRAPAVDFHCPLMSLPLALRAANPHIPQRTPYLFVEAERQRPWRDRLAAFRGRKIGLAYAGSATHRNDHNRSIALAAFLAALPPGPDYVLLQTELRDGDADLLRTRPDITPLGGEIRDFVDTAAICLELDLVISVDTSVAHLAGALGRPLIVLVPYDPDWRWGLGAETSAWYPSAKIWRQRARGDWTTALQDLHARLERGGPPTSPAWPAP